MNGAAARRPSRRARPPGPTLVDLYTGLVPLVTEVEMNRSDPDVFVVGSEVADLAAYGLGTRVVLRGSGAGLNRAAAHGAAVGEAAERFACAVVHPEDLVFGSHRDLRRRGLAAVPPEDWALFAPWQAAGVAHPPFLATTPIAWAPAESLTLGADRLVPASLVYMPYAPAFAARGERVVAHAVSTGTACASSRAEALLKGLCEVVERDAFMIVWRNRLACPRIRIDPASPLAAVFAERFARPGLEYHLFETTLDLPVTSVLGVAHDLRRTPPATFVGGAAHHDPGRAVLKTLLELVQGLKWLDWEGARPFPVEPGFGNVRSFEDRMRLYAANDLRTAFAFLDDGAPARPLSAMGASGRGVRQDVHRAVAGLAAQGLEVLAVDLTPENVAACGLHVVKVLVPGCEPMEGDARMPFLGGRRWREVPRRLGRTSPAPPAHPASPAGTNPFPHPYP